MPILTHYAYYQTVLKIALDHGPLHRKKVHLLAAEAVGLSEDEFSHENERGTNIFKSRIHWAVMDLVGVGALERPTRGMVSITDFGKELLLRYPSGFNRKDLEALPQWKDWKSSWTAKSNNMTPMSSVSESALDQTPDERFDAALDELNSNLANELIKKIQSLPPIAMEKIVLQLLYAMGYGENEEATQHLGGVGDEGVDGVISLDKLGLQKIYVQAKRYKDDSKIDPTTIQAFIGALTSKKAVGGVFITTSEFTTAAIDASTKSNLPIELIDGRRLGTLLIEHKVGVRTLQVIYRSELDEAHFEDLES